jgi:hypothetical protein
MLHARLLFASVLLVTAPAAAQTPLTPSDELIVDVANPGQMRSGTGTILRPHTNVVFEYRIDGGAPVAAVKAAACTALPTPPGISCRLVAPPLTPGAHTIEVRALVSPAETGVTPAAYSTPLAVAMILVTGPSTPINVRIGSRQGP